MAGHLNSFLSLKYTDINWLIEIILGFKLFLCIFIEFFDLQVFLPHSGHSGNVLINSAPAAVISLSDMTHRS